MLGILNRQRKPRTHGRPCGFALGCDFDPNRKQSINTVLEAKWSLTPFALEISEFLSDTKDEYFWAYLEYLAEDDIVNRNMNEKQFYENLLEFTSR